MRKFFTICLSVLLFSCLSEDSVEPGGSATFIRYFNGGNNDEARGMEIAEDGGYIVLATTRIQVGAASAETKIKLIKTDVNGNPVWQRLYPGFTVKDRNYTASAVQVIPNDGGYIIIGNVIEKDSLSKSFVLQVNNVGQEVDSATFRFDRSVPESGTAIALDGNGNYVALSTNDTTLSITQLNQNLDVVSEIHHPISADGDFGFARRLIITSTGRAVVSGMRQVSGLTGVRLLQTLPDSPTVDFDLLLSEPGYSLAGYDFCSYGQGFAVAGATNLKPDGSAGADTDIMFYLTDANGNRIRLTSFPFDDPNTPENEDQIDAGSSISTTIDGGLIFLSSINSQAIDGRGDTDFYLIKIDAFGNKQWTSSFGSRFSDESVVIRQTKDGYYVALGTTTQGQLKILTLFKTDKNGKIE